MVEMKDQKFASIPMNSSTVQQKRTRIGSPQLSLMLVGVLLFGIVFSFHFHDSKPRNSLSRERQPSFVSDQAATPKFSVNEADPSLKVAWLMSFPNSGTSFTSKMIRHIAQMSTASNYGEENRDANGYSVPVYPNRSLLGGPFWIDPRKNPDFTHPTKFVLCKTHCGGRCEKCGPNNWAETPHSFLVQCLSGKRGYVKDNKTMWEMVSYDASLVGKAVHLIRNPFDNVVSRFHLEQHAFRKANDTENLEMYPLNREGFRAFCRILDRRFAFEEENSRFIDHKVLSKMKRIPCHADFMRFVQWHNLAFITTMDLNLPTYILHYENYETRYKATVRELVNFLELPSRGDLIGFIRGKEYRHYYTTDERMVIREAVQALSLAVTWENLSHYFVE